MSEDKSKVKRIGKNGEENEVNISLNNRKMGDADTYRYLGVDISIDSKIEEVNHRISGKESMGAMKDMWKQRHISIETKEGMYERLSGLDQIRRRGKDSPRRIVSDRRNV